MSSSEPAAARGEGRRDGLLTAAGLEKRGPGDPCSWAHHRLGAHTWRMRGPACRRPGGPSGTLPRLGPQAFVACSHPLPDALVLVCDTAPFPLCRRGRGGAGRAAVELPGASQAAALGCSWRPLLQSGGASARRPASPVHLPRAASLNAVRRPPCLERAPGGLEWVSSYSPGLLQS